MATAMEVDGGGGGEGGETHQLLVRRQHLELEAGVVPRAGGYVSGCTTITCLPPPTGHGDVRRLTLHAHELAIRRVTIDGNPARVVRRGRVTVRPDGSDQGDDDEGDAGEAQVVQNMGVGSGVSLGASGSGGGSGAAGGGGGGGGAAAAADGARQDAKVLNSGDGDELIIELVDGGVIVAWSASAPPPPAATDTATATAAADTLPPRHDVVVRVWYAAGPAIGRPGAPPGNVPNAWKRLAPPLPRRITAAKEIPGEDGAQGGEQPPVGAAQGGAVQSESRCDPQRLNPPGDPTLGAYEVMKTRFQSLLNSNSNSNSYRYTEATQPSPNRQRPKPKPKPKRRRRRRRSTTVGLSLASARCPRTWIRRTPAIATWCAPAPRCDPPRGSPAWTTARSSCTSAPASPWRRTSRRWRRGCSCARSARRMTGRRSGGGSSSRPGACRCRRIRWCWR